MEDYNEFELPLEEASIETLRKNRYEDTYSLALECGYSEEQALELKATIEALYATDEDFEKYLAQRESIEIGRLLPIGLITTYPQWLAQTKLFQEKTLWDAGMNTVEYPYILDVLCTSIGGRRYCGLCVYGQERTDVEWINKIVEGVRVASMEAQLSYKSDPSLNEELRRLGMGG